MTRRQTLLLCGVLSPLVYALADGLAGMRWEQYSFRDQTISELAAIGAPSRLLFSTVVVLAYLLLTAFAFGVWQSGADSPRLRAAGGLLFALGFLALTVGQFVPMRPRGAEQGLLGALHLAEGLVAMVILVAAMAFAAAALDRRFRAYTILTIGVMVAFGAWSMMDAPRIEAGLATPWVGVKERVFWYAYQLWFIVLALKLLYEHRSRAAELGGAHETVMRLAEPKSR